MNHQLISHIEEVVALTNAEKKIISAVWTSQKIRKKQFLLEAGEICKYEYFVLRGCFKTYFIDNFQKEHIIRFGTENHLVGDLYSFLAGTPSIYFIEAMEDGEVLKTDNNNWEMLCRQIPVFEKYIRIKIERAYASQQTRVINNFSMTATEKYQAFINQYPTLEQRITQNQVSAYLGITPQFLSQVRKNLAKNGKKIK
jgi:CRP-like cAMP-binding protein